MATADHLKALVRSHVEGDDERFHAIALQIAARAARSGQHRYADELKKLLDRENVADTRSPGPPTPISKPRGDVADLVNVSYPTARIADLVLPQELTEQLVRVLHEQRQRRKLEEHGLHAVHRLLLEGPPGTGKTFTAGVISHELGIPLFTIRLDSLLSKYMGETSSKLRLLFDAIASTRAVYFFDEFDALGGDRAGNDVGEARRILNSFLSFMEEASTESVVIAATNHRSSLDKALFRRFDLVLSYPMPDEKSGVAVLRRRLRGFPGRIGWARIAKEVTGLSHAELVKAAESAAKESILSGDGGVSTEKLVRAINERRASSRA